ncbi:hypothetical protein [Thermoactinospora rubra]|uniref:hypothetical protein n=1 Tax=Thermoactinospora rubra TaxID=1088767 RepID=UPI000A110405|nr:hypothetical protein [Thermoactinospora rubra]
MSSDFRDAPDRQVWPPSGEPPLARRRSQPVPPDEPDELEDWEPERLAAGSRRGMVIWAAIVFVALALVGIGLGAMRSAKTSPVREARADQPAMDAEAGGTADARVSPVPRTGSPGSPAGSPGPQAGSPGPRSAAPVPGRTTITPAQARKVHDRFQRELSAAQQRLDDKAVGELEQGLALEMTRASFQTARMRREPLAAGIWPGTRVWVPRRTAGEEEWFAAVMHEPGVARVTDVLVATPDGWRLVASTADTRDPAPELPAMAVNADGYAESLPESATGLRATPRQVALAHLRSLEAATEDPLFAEGPWTSGAARFWQRERAQLRAAGWRLSLSYRLEGRVRALRTADGGALVWYAARSTEARTAQRPGTKVALKGPAGVRTGNRSFARTASATYGRMYLAYVPPAGSRKPVQVMGDWSDVLESHGS